MTLCLSLSVSTWSVFGQPPNPPEHCRAGTLPWRCARQRLRCCAVAGYSRHVRYSPRLSPVSVRVLCSGQFTWAGASRSLPTRTAVRWHNKEAPPLPSPPPREKSSHRRFLSTSRELHSTVDWISVSQCWLGGHQRSDQRVYYSMEKKNKANLWLW